MATKEQKPIVYEARDGQTVTLDFATITKFLVQGHPEYVTAKEMVYFIGICRSRGLNPFNKDCYLLKYTQKDAAAIIIARDYKRKQAKAQPDCQGWAFGAIVQRDKEIVYSKGLTLPGDILLGGWFRAQPKGWVEPFELEVNLSGYIKKTTTGDVTRFWSKEKQPTMIAKVAESQGLTACWPGEFGHMYIEEEIGSPEMFKTAEQAAVEASEQAQEEVEEAAHVPSEWEDLRAKLLQKGATAEQIETFIQGIMAGHNMSHAEVEESAVNEAEDFINAVMKSIPKPSLDPAQELKEKLETGDKEIEGYGATDLSQGQKRHEKLKSRMTEEETAQWRKEEKDLEEPSNQPDMIEWLRICRPSTSLKNAREAMKIFDDMDDEIQFLDDHVLRDQLIAKRKKTENFIKKHEAPEEPPMSPGAQDQAKRREAFFSFCRHANSIVEDARMDGDERPDLLETVLNDFKYSDLNSIPEIGFREFKDGLINEAAKREVIIN